MILIHLNLHGFPICLQIAKGCEVGTVHTSLTLRPPIRLGFAWIDQGRRVTLREGPKNRKELKTLLVFSEGSYAKIKL